MACTIMGFMATAAMVCMMVLVLSAILKPPYDESWADDREFD